MQVYYFGCWGVPGHFLFRPGGHSVPWAIEREITLHHGDGHIDGALAPRRDRYSNKIVFDGQMVKPEDRWRIKYQSNECPQGQYLVHQLPNGFTAMSWWDRTQGDSRSGCNSIFLLEGSHTRDEMLKALEQHFPSVLANLKKAGVELVHAEEATLP